MAYGACVQAAVLAKKPGTLPVYVRNVTPLSIGIVGVNRQCFPIINRNSSYPLMTKIQGRTRRENQTKAKISLYEGEHSNLNRNRVLGTMMLLGLTPAPTNNEIVDITISIDDKATISTAAVDRRTKNEVKLNNVKTEEFSEQDISEMAKNIGQLRKGADTVEVEKDSKPSQSKRPKIERDENDESEAEECPIYGLGLAVQTIDQLELGD